jgi:hypothetical protein
MLMTPSGKSVGGGLDSFIPRHSARFRVEVPESVRPAHQNRAVAARAELSDMRRDIADCEADPAFRRPIGL